MIDVKKGDRINRYFGDGTIFMQMEVLEVKDGVITCAAVKEGHLFYGGWTFDQATGAEIDEELSWGPKYGRTGTYVQGDKPVAIFTVEKNHGV